MVFGLQSPQALLIYFSITASKMDYYPFVLNRKIVDDLFQETVAAPGYRLKIDLPRQKITKPDGSEIDFDVDEFGKHCLLDGLDDIGITLKDDAAIRAFEDRWQQQSPWYFDTPA